MGRIYTIILLFFLITETKAQIANFEWAKQVSGGFGSFSSDVATDAAGNVYTTGSFNGIVDFDPGPLVYNLNSGDYTAIFVSKQNSQGQLIWARAFVTTDIWGDVEQGHSIAVDPAGNVYTMGAFEATVDFDPGPGTYELTAYCPGWTYGAYISKLNSSGNFVWASVIQQTGIGTQYALTTDASGNVYATGNFNGTSDFDPGPGVYNLSTHPSAYYDIFVTKLSPSGSLVWAKSFEGRGFNDSWAISVDGAGNVYTTGSFADTVDFDPGPGVHYIDGTYSLGIYVSKLNSAGNFVWAREFRKQEIAGDNRSYDIKNDAAGNVYVTGAFQFTTDFDPGSGTYNMVSAGGTDIFVAKLTSGGNFIWAKQMGGIDSDGALGMALDDAGNVYTTGYFYESTGDFDPGPGTANLTSVSSNDVFISKLDPDGNYLWAGKIGGSSRDDGSSIAVDKGMNIYVTGGFFETCDFDPGTPVFNMTASTYYSPTGNAFNLKLSQPCPARWAKNMGGGSADEGHAVVIDREGNIYTTGKFTDIADMDPNAGTFYLSSHGGSDIYILKQSPCGRLLWARSMGSLDDDEGNGVAVDEEGNVYITGAFQGECTFDMGTSGSTLNAVGGSDIFVCSFDTEGSYRWAKNMGGYYEDRGTGIAIDAGANVYYTGYFYGWGNFDVFGSNFTLNSNGQNDIVIGKLDRHGNFNWAVNIGLDGDDRGSSIATDHNSNIYTTGQFESIVDFDPGLNSYNLASAGGLDMFISKLNSNGDFVYARHTGGGYDDYSTGIAVDNEDNVYYTGHFSDEADFDPGSNYYPLPSGGAFVSKLDAYGDFSWAGSVEGEQSEYSYGITVDEERSVYFTGSFNGGADFDPGADTYYLSCSDVEDIFICKWNEKGDFVWAKSVENSSPSGLSQDEGRSIAADNAGFTYVTGRFHQNADFKLDSNGTHYLTSNGNADIFVCKMDSDNGDIYRKGRAINQENPVNLNSEKANVYPNPFKDSFKISHASIQSEVTYTVTDILGKTVYTSKKTGITETEITLKQPSGLYFLTISGTTKKQVLKLVKE